MPCLHSVRKPSLSATLCCLDRLALVNLFSIFKTFPFFSNITFFFLSLGKQSSKDRCGIRSITLEVFRVFLPKLCV